MSEQEEKIKFWLLASKNIVPPKIIIILNIEDRNVFPQICG